MNDRLRLKVHEEVENEQGRFFVFCDGSMVEV